MTLASQLSRTQLELALAQAENRHLKAHASKMERELYNAETCLAETERLLEQARSLAATLEAEAAK